MVGARCAVASCSNSYKIAKKRGRVLSLHSFPKDPDLKEFWIDACSRGDVWNPDTSFVCSDHFALEDFISDQRLQLWTGMKWRPQLKPGAVPTRNLPRTKSNHIEGIDSPEPHRFSMYEVVSIELERRLEKALRAPSAQNSIDANDGDTGCPKSVTRPAFCTNPDQNPSCDAPLDISNEPSDERKTSDCSKNTGSENDDSCSKKSRSKLGPTNYSNSKTPPKIKGITRDTPTKPMTDDDDTSAKKSHISPANGAIIYSCPAFELFVDE